MKQFLILISIIGCVSAISANDTIPILMATTKLSDTPYTISGSAVYIFPETFKYGYNPTGEYDTIKAVLLITDCDDCQSKSISAYAVREKHTYFGDRMPTFPFPTSYNDYWEIKSYLDKNKKPFLNIIIWQIKLKQ